MEFLEFQGPRKDDLMDNAMQKDLLQEVFLFLLKLVLTNHEFY